MRSIVLRQSVPADVHELWQACAEPQGIMRWQADRASGRIAVGGRLKLAYPALNVELELEIVDVVPDRRLELKTGTSRVHFDFEPGSVTFGQAGFETEEEAEGSASGWRLSLALLEHYLTRHAGQSRTVHWFFRPVRVSASAAHVFFTDRNALRAWLASDSTGIDAERVEYGLRLMSGRPMSGRVLACTTERDVALSWREDDDSVLCLRTLPSPRHPDERLVVLYWSRWTQTPANKATLLELGAALDRLVRLLSRPMRA